MIGALLPLAISLISSYVTNRKKNAGTAQSGGSSGGDPSIAGLMRQFPQLQQALDVQTARMQRTDPLHDALTRLGMQFTQQPFNVRTAAADMPPTVLNPHRLPLG